MKFVNAARVFETVQAYDAYSGRFAFWCQPAAFESAKSSGSTTKHQVLATSTDITIPVRRCIGILGETWIMGDGSEDGLFNASMRKTFWLRKATDTFTYQTPGQAAIGSGGTVTFAMREYLKDTVDNVSVAEYFAQYEVFLSKTESPVKNGYFRNATRLLRIRAVRDDVSGFTMCSSDDLGLDAEITATFTSSTYDPITDSKTVTALGIPALIFNRVLEYVLQTEADHRYMPGDKTLIVSKSSITPAVGQEITAEGQSWKALEVTSQNDAWSIHLRRR